MVLRTRSLGDLEDVLAGVHVDPGQASVRRLEERQPLRSAHRLVLELVEVLRGARFRLALRDVVGRADHRDAGGAGERVHVQNAGVRVHRRAGETGPATGARDDECPELAVLAFDDERLEDRTELQRGRDLQRLLAQFRREVDEVVLRRALAVEGGRLGRERLGRRQHLAGHGALRHRAVLDGPDGLAGDTVEDVGERGLRDLGQRLDGLAVDHDVHDVRRRADVVVPDAVVDGLEVPDAFAGFDVQADDALREQVVANTVAAVVVVGRRGQGDVDVAEFLVGREHRPGVGVALPPPGLVAPGFRERLAFLRDRVEAPLQLAGAHVVGAYVARRVSLVRDVVVDLGADNHGVADDDGRRAVRDVRRHPIAIAEVADQVHHAVVAERRVGLAGRGIDGDELLAEGRDQDAFGLAVGPVLDAAGAARQLGRQFAGPATRVVEPELLAGRRVQRGHLAVRRGGVHRAADHQGRGRVAAGVVGALEAGVGGLPAPRHLQLGEVLGVDLVERRVLGRCQVRAVVPPFAGGAGIRWRAARDVDQGGQGGPKEEEACCSHGRVPFNRFRARPRPA